MKVILAANRARLAPTFRQVVEQLMGFDSLGVYGFAV
jgi:hypothetical protein